MLEYLLNIYKPCQKLEQCMPKEYRIIHVPEWLPFTNKLPQMSVPIEFCMPMQLKLSANNAFSLIIFYAGSRTLLTAYICPFYWNVCMIHQASSLVWWDSWLNKHALLPLGMNGLFCSRWQTFIWYVFTGLLT